MIITAIRVGKTFNTGNYTSHKVEIEAVPDNGQSLEDAIQQVTAIVDAQNTAEGATAPAKKAEPKSTAPPLKGKGKTEANPPASSTPAKDSATSTENLPKQSGTQSKDSPPTSEEPPFEPGKDVAAEPAPKKGRGRPKKHKSEVDGVDELLVKVPECQSVNALLAVFNDMRSVADRTVGEACDKWEIACRTVAGQLRSIPAHATSEHYEDIVKAFNAEKEAIAIAREHA